MRRRDFIKAIGGVAVPSPIAAYAQPSGSRRIGVLAVESNRDTQAKIAAFREGLQTLGWSEGRNLHIDYRWAGVEGARRQAQAAELVKLSPAVLFATGITSLSALTAVARTIPIVFAQVGDPVANGFVASIARPGGNITGFALFEEGIAVKWLELLKEIAPGVARAGFLYDPGNPAAERYARTIGGVSASFGVRFSEIVVHSSDEIQRTVDAFAREPNGGLIVHPSPAVSANLDLITALAARHRLPAVSSFRDFTVAGVLASYGVDVIDLHRSAAGYVDRILKGDKPGDLPVQFSTKFELVINLKTAKLLGLDPPTALLARTDEVIE
jgi:putative ABC transport system substrate-binding protein